MPDNTKTMCTILNLSQNLDGHLLLHPPYSPDLSPSTRYHFLYLKDSLQGHCGMDDQILQNTAWLGCRRREYYNRHENLPCVQGGGSLLTEVENY
jgi:hypothetical protein